MSMQNEVILTLHINTLFARIAMKAMTPLVLLGIMPVEAATGLAERLIRVRVTEER
jgi:hypothetical protein